MILASELSSHHPSFLSSSTQLINDTSIPHSSRQNLNNINYVATFAANAIKILSLIMSAVNENENEDKKSEVDRVDTSSDGDFDEAMGTLMAFGGKYLRQMSVWLFEMTTNVPSEIVNGENQGMLGGEIGYLERLTNEELKRIAEKAVKAGANPLKLQEAYNTAQNKGDWTDLENGIAEVLGPEAVGGSPIGGTNVLNSLSSSLNSASSMISESLESNSSEPYSPFYLLTVAQNYIKRFDTVVQESNSSFPSLLTKLIHEFKLENEALTFQNAINSVIVTVNSFLEPQKSISDKIDSEESSGLIDSISETLRNSMYSLFNFLGPKDYESSQGSDKVPESKYIPGVFGVLGTTGALLTLAYSAWIAERKPSLSQRHEVQSEDFMFTGNSEKIDEFHQRFENDIHNIKSIYNGLEDEASRYDTNYENYYYSD